MSEQTIASKYDANGAYREAMFRTAEFYRRPFRADMKASMAELLSEVASTFSRTAIYSVASAGEGESWLWIECEHDERIGAGVLHNSSEWFVSADAKFRDASKLTRLEELRFDPVGKRWFVPVVRDGTDEQKCALVHITERLMTIIEASEETTRAR